ILPIDAAIQSNLRETTTRVLASLTPREERVLRMRFGIGMNTDHTLEEVGQQFSVTRERIRQIQAQALRKVKHPSRSRKLRSLLDNSHGSYFIVPAVASEVPYTAAPVGIVGWESHGTRAWCRRSALSERFLQSVSAFSWVRRR